MTEHIVRRQFKDLATYSSTDKTAISIRDGVLEYLGSELNIEPSDKVFKVYRSPATIANVASCMSGIPLTDEHVSLDSDAPETGSMVDSSVIIDTLDESTNTCLSIKNKVSVTDAMAELIADKKELSLGYYGDLVPHSKWDFEQVSIVPHHLAAVPAGRCGSLCSFLDRKPQIKNEDITMKKLHQSFLDADGAMSLEQIVEVATALPDAIRKAPIEELPKVMPAMMEIMKYAKEQGAVDEEELDELADEEMEEKPLEDAEPEKDKDEDKDKEKKFSDALAVQSKKFADAEVKKFSSVVGKAISFLDEDYDFSGKTANDVMRDSLASLSSEKFEDSELSVAFKLLRKNTDYSQFGDSRAESALDARIKSDLGD